MPTILTIYDITILHDHFAKKTEPTEEDKGRVKKLDDALGLLVDGLVDRQMPLEEILRKILEIMPPKTPS